MIADEQQALWMAWGSYLEHLQPHGGDPCPDCLAGSTLGEGCPEGQQLWAEYKESLSIYRDSKWNVPTPQ